MLQNIKDLYTKVDKKNDFILLLSQEFSIKPNSIRTNWFQTFFSIPEKHQSRVLELLQKRIQLQNKVECEI